MTVVDVQDVFPKFVIIQLKLTKRWMLTAEILHS